MSDHDQAISFISGLNAFLDDYTRLKIAEGQAEKLLHAYIESIARRLGVKIVDDRVELLRSVDSAIDALLRDRPPARAAEVQS